jgi:hypothetical protein
MRVPGLEIDLAQDVDKRRALVVTVITIEFRKTENFLIG